MVELKEARRISNSALWRTFWRRVIRQPYQYLLLTLGIALGVAMMVSIDIANGSASRAFQLSTEAVVGKTTHRIYGSPAGIDEAIYTRLKTDIGYNLAAPIVEGYILSDDLGGIPRRLFGMDLMAEPPFRTMFADLDSETVGAMTALLLEPDSVMVSDRLAEEFALQVGDAVEIRSTSGNPSIRVVGIFQTGGENDSQGTNDIIFADISTAQYLLGMVGKLSYIDLIAGDDDDLEAVAALLPPGVVLEPSAARRNALKEMTAAFELNLTALSMLAMVVATFLIYNVVTFNVVQRRRLFGILRCLGVVGDQLFSLILVEALLLGLAGAILGLGLGILLGKGMVNLVSQTINDLYFVLNVRQIDISAATIIKGLFVGLFASLVASIIPAWEAKQINPIGGLHRSSLEEKAQKTTHWLLLGFLFLFILGALLLFLEWTSLIAAFAGLFIVLVSFAFLVPSLIKVTMPFLSRLLHRVFGAIGRMAPRDIDRSMSRTAVAIAALMIAISVIIGVSIMIGSFRLTVDQWLSNTLQADIFFSTPTLTANKAVGTLPPEVVDDARSWPGVVQAVTAWNDEVTAPEFGRSIEVIAVDGDISAGNRRYAWIQSDPAVVWQALERGEGVLVSEPLTILENLEIPPQPIVLQTNSGPQAFPVLGVFYDYSSEQGSILMEQTLYRRWWGDHQANSLGLFLEPNLEATAVARELQGHFSGRENVIIQTNQAVRSNALDIFDRTFAITLALELLAIIVAFIGILSALMSIQLERTRELGILRASGMTIRQMWRLIILETGLMGVAAGLLALPVGSILAWILIYVINRRSFGWTLDMHLEPTYYLQAFAVALIAALLAGIVPSLRASGLQVAAAIREE